MEKLRHTVLQTLILLGCGTLTSSKDLFGTTDDGRSVSGALISTDYALEMNKTFLHLNTTLEGSKSPQYRNAKIGSARGAHARALMQTLPFPVVEWPPVFTKNCPSRVLHHHTHSERGLMLAHFQIWWEFVFFDHDVLLFRNQKKHSFPLVGTYNSTAFSSVSGQFALTANGTLLKNGLPFREDDILVVF
jgi:hypothetical protein